MSSSLMSAPLGAQGLADSVDLRVVRFDGQSGRTFVSNGIPLAAGALRAADLPRLRLSVAGTEVPARFEPLAGTHRDGTLRSVLVQFWADVPLRGWRPATLRLVREPRPTPANVTEPTGFDRGLTSAVALPIEPTYLVATQLSGPTRASRESRTFGAAFAKWETDFASHADKHWQQDGENWAAANYYDRALIYSAFWQRTGNPTYFRRATQLARNYRTHYLEANAYQSSPHWSQLEGLEQQYLLTGDEQSRAAIARVAETLETFPFADTLNTTWMESRIQARGIQALFLAWRLNAVGPKRLDLAQRLEDVVRQTISVQRPDGSIGWPVSCRGSLNYMYGLLNDQLINIHTHFRADPAIVAFVRRNADHLWNTQWVDAAQSFKYLSVRCAKNAQGDDVGGPDPAPDLNMLFVTTYGWLYEQTGDVRYRQWGDRIFAGGVDKSYLDGSKQFNQQYTSAFKYLSQRLATARSSTTR